MQAGGQAAHCSALKQCTAQRTVCGGHRSTHADLAWRTHGHEQQASKDRGTHYDSCKQEQARSVQAGGQVALCAAQAL